MHPRDPYPSFRVVLLACVERPCWGAIFTPHAFSGEVGDFVRNPHMFLLWCPNALFSFAEQ